MLCDEIWIANEDGRVLRKLGRRGRGRGEFFNIQNIAICGSNLVVADEYRIQLLRKGDGSFLHLWYFAPTSRVFIASHAVFVIDNIDNRVRAFDLHGTFRFGFTFHSALIDTVCATKDELILGAVVVYVLVHDLRDGTFLRVVNGPCFVPGVRLRHLALCPNGQWLLLLSTGMLYFKDPDGGHRNSTACLMHHADKLGPCVYNETHLFCLVPGALFRRTNVLGLGDP
jgi:hypothetical protein